MRTGWVGLLATLAITAQAQELASDQRLDRVVTLFQNAPAEFADHYQITDFPIRLVDLPAAPIAGSCDMPGVAVESIYYSSTQAKFDRGQVVDLWIRDPSLGQSFQQASVAWRQGSNVGFRLPSGQILPWQPGADWAHVLQPPTAYAGLVVDGDLNSDRAWIRCAINGPSWQARYTALHQQEQLQLSLDALIQVPNGQSFGTASVVLSSDVGRDYSVRPRMVELASATAGESLEDGQWRYAFARPLELGAGANAYRLWTQSLPITRVHRLQHYLTAVRPVGQASLPVRRQWLIENASESAMPPGQLRIQSDQYGHPLVGVSRLSAMAPGAEQWIDLGASLSVSASLGLTSRIREGNQVKSVWSLAVENSGGDPARVGLTLQTDAKAQLTGVPETLELAAGQRRVLQIQLSEPMR